MKTALVSGAGSGIGRATCVALARSGFRIVLLGRREDALRETQSLLENPGQHLSVSADIGNASSLKSAFREIQLDSLNLTAVVANAGVGGENVYGAEDRWSEILDTNLSGTYRLVNEALPALRKSQQEFKHVLVVSSVLARLGVPHYSAYCASKAGLLGLVRSWAAEWAREKILVNAVCPGWVETQMARQGLELMANGTGRSYEDIHAEQMAMVPLGKMSRPQEVGEFIEYLVSDRQTSFTGQSFDMNNGAVMV